MEKDLYRIMSEIKEAKKTENKQEIYFMGKIISSQKVNNIDIEIERDINV